MNIEEPTRIAYDYNKRVLVAYTEDTATVFSPVTVDMYHAVLSSPDTEDALHTLKEHLRHEPTGTMLTFQRPGAVVPDGEAIIVSIEPRAVASASGNAKIGALGVSTEGSEGPPP